MTFYTFRCNKKPSASPRAFYCSEMCKKSKSPPFYTIENCKHLYWILKVMEDDSDEADDIPTIKVGGEEYEITDVTHEIIAR